MGVLTRAEHVEVSETDRLNSIDPAEADAIPLGSQLRDGMGQSVARKASSPLGHAYYLEVHADHQVHGDPHGGGQRKSDQQAADKHRRRLDPT